MDIKKDPRFNNITPFKSKVWLASPTMHGDELFFVKDAFEKNWITTAGENVNECERLISELVGCKYAVGLSCGTAALHLCIKLAGEKLYGQPKPNVGTLFGKKVFCSDMTFDATVNPVAYEDGEAVFIDTEYDSWNMDPIALEKAFEIYPDVKIIVVAHLYGTPGNIDEIKKIADNHGALIIEDAAESLGAMYKISNDSPFAKKFNVGSGEEKWIQTGCFGDYSAISFNGNKIITGSSGGMFLTDSLEDANKVRKWSTQSREDAPWYQHEEIGYNYRISNIVAGVVRGQIGYLSEHIEQKKSIYERYKIGLQDLPVSMNPIDESVCIPNYWLSCLLIDKDAMAPYVRGENDQLWISESGKSSPGEILEALAEFNVEGRPIWKPMHLQAIYRSNAFITREGNGRARSNAYINDKKINDVGADIFYRGLCLPSDNKMTIDIQERVIEIIHRCFE